ncbi:zinc ABC transporter substrate-binding protein [Leucothrix pacifica]|nr:zinc ABC transporter substrate-binding protein [Leucothrix pacifica]
MKRIVLFFAMIAALTAPLAGAADKPLILSTIKPVHALVSTIAGDTAETIQMVPDYASPHHYSLKPSDLRRLAKASLVFRIDPMMEAQLNKSLNTINQDKVIVLSRSAGIQLLEAGHSHHEASHSGSEETEHSDEAGDKAKDSHKEHEEHEEHEEHSGSEHSDEAKDYHLWLDPHNAIAMVKTIRDRLSNALPDHKTQFETNAQKLIAAIELTDSQIREQLAAVTTQPYLVMHDAWQYFTKHYELKQLGSITQQEGLQASGKAISDARRLIQSSGVSCIVTEPGVKIRTLRVLTEDLKVSTTEIDPLGRAIPLSDQTYPELLRYTATQLRSCLEPK